MNIRAKHRVLLALASFSGLASASPVPIPDPSYGGAGDGLARVLFDVPPYFAYEPFAAAALPDGSLLLGGRVAGQSSADAAFALLTPAGTPDSRFGPNHDGRLVAGLAPAEVNGLLATADSQFVFVGDASSAAMIGRMSSTGELDVGFDLDGQRLVGADAFLDGGVQALFERAVPEADGKLLAIGSAASTTSVCAVAMRFNAEDGSTDMTFGAGLGHVCIAPANTTPLSEGLDVATLADGRILIAGTSLYPGSSSGDMSVARLLQDGSPDMTFGPAHDGWAFVPFELLDSANAIAVDASGRIVLAGDVSTSTQSRIGVARLLADGTLDDTFGTHGRAEFDFDDAGYISAEAHSVRALADGHVLIGGRAIANGADYSSILIMLQPDGQLEPRFGQNGRFIQADLATPISQRIYGYGQLVAGDYVYMFGDTLDPADQATREFGAARVVLPLFGDGFDTAP